MTSLSIQNMRVPLLISALIVTMLMSENYFRNKPQHYRYA